jgi:hypothetical protein
VVQDAEEHQRNRLGQVERPRRIGEDLLRIMHVAVDIGATRWAAS